jgi:hypothetical protein
MKVEIIGGPSDGKIVEVSDPPPLFLYEADSSFQALTKLSPTQDVPRIEYRLYYRTNGKPGYLHPCLRG